MHDIIIRGGRIIDGAGGAAQVGDVAISDGVITEVGKVSGPARQTISADGAIVTPGFIDVHTHYDGEFMWDDQLDPSFSNGVTTAIAGNCGVGFAPVKQEHRKMLMELMEGVEEIPGAVLEEGLDWRWESFPDYLNRLDERKYSMDIGVNITHAPLRVFAMGERAARHETATAEDIDHMSKLVVGAMEAGAIGFSAARFLGHRSSTGAHVPGTFADESEFVALAAAMGSTGKGVFQIVPHGAAGDILGDPASRRDRLEEHERFVRIAEAAGRPLTYSLLQYESDPSDWKMMLEATERANAAGVRIHPQTAARAAGNVIAIEGYHPFMLRPAYLEIAHLPLAERVSAMRAPALRARILAEADAAPTVASDPSTGLMVGVFRKLLPSLYLMSQELDYEPTPDRSLEQLARRSGATMDEELYDHLTTGDGRQFAVTFAANYGGGSLNVAHEMLANPLVISSLSDAGAHVKSVCDGALPSFQLAFWCRDRVRGPKLPLEFMVRKATFDCASLYGLDDRGLIAPGKRADINVIDFDRLRLGMPKMAWDLPSGAGRFLQKAEGYLATIVAGSITRRNDEDTMARPGRLVRSK